jgi:hypothetical protein
MASSTLRPITQAVLGGGDGTALHHEWGVEVGQPLDVIRHLGPLTG